MTAQPDENQQNNPDTPAPSSPPPPQGDRIFRAFGTPEAFRENITRLKNDKPIIDTANPNIATPEQVRGFISSLRRRVKYDQLTKTEQDSLGPGVCELLQKGAVSPKFEKSRKSELFKGNLTAGNILDSLKDVDRGLTPRKLARSIRSEILETATVWAIPGNLSKKYSQVYPDASMNELIWASDFHTFSDDPNMPDQVRNWLIENYTSRFDKK